MKGLLHAIVIVVVGVVVGKWCQYAAVDYLGDRLGFNCASLIGLTPFVICLVYLKVKYPRVLGYRKRLQGE